jgi:hypothetical protein
MLDIFIWLALSTDWSIKKVQHANLNVENVTKVDEIAERLFIELECRKYILLLDEVWKFLFIYFFFIHVR